MKPYTIFLLLIILSAAVFAQSNVDHSPQRQVLAIKNIQTSFEKNGDNLYSEVLAIPLQQISPFLAFSISWEQTINEEAHIHGSPFSVRFVKNKKEEAAWMPLAMNPHGDRSVTKQVSELMFANRNSKFIQIKIQNVSHAEQLNNVQLHFYSPGKTVKEHANTQNERPKNNTCPCPIPNFEDRNDWCPSGDCPKQTSPTFTSPTHLIIHHSAGTNASSDWAGVVRSIWDYHVNSNGWADVGYNWLVDPNGVLYEGRGDNVLGAHFCAQNSATMGVCVMGDFTNISPTDDAKNKLAELLGWKVCDIDADPLGTAFHSGSNMELDIISGHRDGCSTACPGNTFYPQMSAIRTSVNNYINNDCIATGFTGPSNLIAMTQTTTSIRLEWIDNSSDETGFLVERSKSNNENFEQIASLPTNVQFFLSTGLENNTTYFYRTRATSDQDTSEYSNEASASTNLNNIIEGLNENNVQIFPNPTAGVFTVRIMNDWQGPLEIKIRDVVFGSVITREAFEKFGAEINIPLNIEHLSSGVYLIQLSNGDNRGVFRIVKH